MNTTIKTTGISLTPSLEQYTRYKLAKLLKFIGGDKEGSLIEVELAKTTDHHKHGEIYRSELNLQIPGQELMRAEATDYDLYVSIVIARDELIRQIKGVQDKKQTVFRKSARRLKDSLRFWK